MPEVPPSRLESVFRWVIGVLLVLGFLASARCLMAGWNKSVIDLHEFRQTQTLAASFYFLKDGFSLAYQNPAVGAPWIFPYEFPFYQSVVALLARGSSWSLVHSGRVVSLFFWVASLVPLYGMLRLWFPDRLWRWASILLIWSTPTYLMWSRATLMESTALFFALSYFCAMLYAVRSHSRWWLVLAVLCGSLASLIKVTTFLITVVPLTGLVGLEIVNRRKDGRTWTRVIGWAMAVLIPMAIGFAWTRYTDSVKLWYHYDLDVATSSDMMRRWYFGTLDQRFSTAVWDRLANMEILYGMGRGFLVVLLQVVAVVLAAIRYLPDRRWLLVSLVAGAFTGDLVFTNVFFVHEYYHYETHIYFQLAFAVALYGLTESLSGEGRLWLRYLPMFGLVVLGWFAFREHYVVPCIFPAPTEAQVREELRVVRESTRADDVLLIFGAKNDPALPFYTERYAVVEQEQAAFEGESLQRMLSRSVPSGQVGAFIVQPQWHPDPDFVRRLVAELGLREKPVRSKYFGDIYLPRINRVSGDASP